MMRSVAVINLLTFVPIALAKELVAKHHVDAQTHAKVFTADHNVDTQDSIEKLVDKLTGGLFDNSFGPLLKASPVLLKDLDGTTLGKLGHLVSPPGLQPLLPLRSRSVFTPHHARSLRPSHQLQFRRQAMPRHHVQVSQVEEVQNDDMEDSGALEMTLRRNLSSTLGRGVLITAYAALASSPESAVSFAVGTAIYLIYVQLLSSSVNALSVGNVKFRTQFDRVLRLTITFILAAICISAAENGANIDILALLAGFLISRAGQVYDIVRDLLPRKEDQLEQFTEKYRKEYGLSAFDRENG